jgi:hypothetical protein
MQNRVRLYLSIAYWVMGIGLLGWLYFLVEQSKGEEALAPIWALICLTFPLSFAIEYLASLLGQVVPVGGKQDVFGYVVAGIMLVGGYIQWFYLFPWVFQKLLTFAQVK